MAPGVVHVTALTPTGEISVRILDRAFAGTWRIVNAKASLHLLAAHWKGTRGALSDHQLARAQLRDVLGQTLICEFVLAPDAPSGVCEEPLRRLYYLRPDP